MIKNNFLKRLFSSLFLFLIFYLILIVEDYIFIFFLISLLLISIYEWNNLVSKKLFKLVGILLLCFSFFTVYQIKNIDNNNIFIFIILICVGSDLGGYFIGNLLGGPKLTKISPNKTISGLIGGIFFSIIFCTIYKHLINFLFYEDKFNLLDFNLLVILLSLISQQGDLTMSYFKRKANLKDTGSILPGHGGILDRIDGMVFVFPFFYIFLIINFI